MQCSSPLELCYTRHCCNCSNTLKRIKKWNKKNLLCFYYDLPIERYESDMISKAHNPMFSVNEVRNRMAQILKMAQQDFGSNSFNSLLISAAEAELSNWLERHSSVLAMSRRWQPYSFFSTNGNDSDKDSRLTSIKVNRVWSAKFFDNKTEWVTWKYTEGKKSHKGLFF